MNRLLMALATLSLLLSTRCGGEEESAPADVHAQDVTADSTAPVEETRRAEEPAPNVPEITPDVDYLVVCAGDLLATAQAFADYRQSTGHNTRVATVEEIISFPTLVDEDIVTEVTAFVRAHYDARDSAKPFYLLIVGDAVQTGNDPVALVPAGRWWGEWEGCFSDNFYADMDGDHVPDLNVGRIPVEDDATGLDILSRIRKHETEYVVGPWNHRIHVYAGEGGFGEDIDFIIETVAQKGLESVPLEYDLKFAYDSKTSSYYYAPFEDKVLDLVTQGALLVTFMGHGGGELEVPSLDLVIPKNRQPMYAWFACSTGDFISGYDSDAERVLKQEGGPMAELISTTTTHPYANAVNALEMERSVFDERPETFGEAIRLMKWRSLYNKDEMREMLDAMAVLYMPEDEMAGTILDHMYSYNLLGDPAVRIRFPAGVVTLESPTEVSVGNTLEFSGDVSNLDSGTAHVQIVCERARIIYPQESVEDPFDKQTWPTIQQNWENANNHLVVGDDFPLTAGTFSGTLDIPEDAPKGTFFITVYAEDGTVDAVGSAMVKIKK